MKNKYWYQSQSNFMNKDLPLLFVGLGNPGMEYELTRHNIGAYVVYHFANSIGVSFKEKKDLSGFIGKAVIDGQKVIFLLPTTFMNLSGQAVSKCMNYFDIPVENLLVLSDDTYIPFLDVRLKMGGSAGGHNGLKDIEIKLNTKEYKRLRIGIGEKTTEDLADYVLQLFAKREQEKMDDIVDKCIQIIKTKVIAKEDKALGKNNISGEMK